MKDKTPSTSPSTSSTTQPVIRQRKKPHMLPPLEKRRNSVSSLRLYLMWKKELSLYPGMNKHTFPLALRNKHWQIANCILIEKLRYALRQ
jgi:hypothetical protein